MERLLSDLCVLHPEGEDRRALPSLRLCGSHRDRLEDDIQALPRLYADLDRALTSPTVVTTVSNGPRPARDGDRDPLVLAETALPINPEVADLRDQIRHDLAWWTLEVAEKRGLMVPMQGPRPHVTAKWLGRHVDWIAGNEAAAQACPPVMRGLVGRARALVAPSGARRIAIGPCRGSADGQACPGTLYATVRAEDDTRTSELYCDGDCGLSLDPTQWRRFSREYLRERSAS
jgi:hypothetical protein